IHTRSIPIRPRNHTDPRERSGMNTTQNTQKILVAAVLTASIGFGLGGCSAETHVVAFADRVASDISHEVARAENRVQAAQVEATTADEYRDQAERAAGTTTPLNRTFDQVERRRSLGH